MDSFNQTIDKTSSDHPISVFQSVEPPQGLLERIQGQILLREKKRQKIKLILILFLSVISAMTTLLAIFVFYRQSLNSGIDKIISLIFSDGYIIASFWQDYLYYFLEVLPVMPLVLILIAVTIFLEFLKLSFNNFYKYKLIIKEKNYVKA